MSIVEWFKKRWMLIAVGAFLAIQPLGQEPHLVQKWNLLKNGWLTGVFDWFDFLMHSAVFYVIPVLFVIDYIKARRAT